MHTGDARKCERIPYIFQLVSFTTQSIQQVTPATRTTNGTRAYYKSQKPVFNKIFLTAIRRNNFAGTTNRNDGTNWQYFGISSRMCMVKDALVPENKKKQIKGKKNRKQALHMLSYLTTSYSRCLTRLPVASPPSNAWDEWS